jgi:predicted O-methyltransferase YrrM
MIKKILYTIIQFRFCKLAYRPGHYYSPIVSFNKIKNQEKDIFTIKSKQISGIELYESEQLELLSKLSEMYSSIPFTEEKTDSLRYFFNNTFYTYSDAIFLHLLIRYFQPKSIIEIGSGFSSAVMLDTNNIFFDNQIDITFIEPNPKRLFSLLRNKENENTKTIVTNLQNVNLELFDKLNENDILFVDSTHVSKTGSDVNKILFQILPRLKKGVLIHFHDIFFPFEYPIEWVKKINGFGWNEAYILKAFLMYNTNFKIIMFNTFMEYFHKDWFSKNMPNCLKNEGGSIWIQKQ